MILNTNKQYLILWYLFPVVPFLFTKLSPTFFGLSTDTVFIFLSKSKDTLTKFSVASKTGADFCSIFSL